MQNKKLIKKAEVVCNACNSSKTSSADSIFITNEDVTCLFRNNSLQAAGKIINKNKEGKWYFFDKNCEVDRVIKYNSSKNDSTLLYRGYTVNESW